jgi:hypothetical protein
MLPQRPGCRPSRLASLVPQGDGNICSFSRCVRIRALLTTKKNQAGPDLRQMQQSRWLLRVSDRSGKARSPDGAPAKSGDEDSPSFRCPGFPGACHRAGHFGPGPLVSSGLQKVKEAERRQTRSPTSAPRSGRGARPAGRAACRRSTAALGAASQRRTSAPDALPGTRLPADIGRRPLSQPSDRLAGRSLCRPGVSPKPPGSEGDEPSPAGTASRCVSRCRRPTSFESARRGALWSSRRRSQRVCICAGGSGCFVRRCFSERARGEHDSLAVEHREPRQADGGDVKEIVTFPLTSVSN